MKIPVLIIIVIILLFSCGEDGKEGVAYFSVWGDEYVRYYRDDNPSSPDTIYVNKDYRTGPGTYSFSYISLYEGQWLLFDGTYTITINEGKPGKLFSDGDDGKNNYYRLTLTTISGYSFGLMKSSNIGVDYYVNNDKDLLSYKKIPIGDIVEEKILTSSGELIIKNQMYKLVK